MGQRHQERNGSDPTEMKKPTIKMGRSLGFFPVAFVTGTYWGDKNSHRQCPRSRQDSVTGNKDHFDLPEFITQINNCQLQSAHNSAVFLTVLTSLHRHVESNLRVRPFPRIDFMSVISSPLRNIRQILYDIAWIQVRSRVATQSMYVVAYLSTTDMRPNIFPKSEAI